MEIVTLQEWFAHHRFSGVWKGHAPDATFIELSVPERPGEKTYYMVRGNALYRQIQEATKENDWTARYEGITHEEMEKSARALYAPPAETR